MNGDGAVWSRRYSGAGQSPHCEGCSSLHAARTLQILLSLWSWALLFSGLHQMCNLTFGHQALLALSFSSLALYMYSRILFTFEHQCTVTDSIIEGRCRCSCRSADYDRVLHSFAATAAAHMRSLCDSARGLSDHMIRTPAAALSALKGSELRSSCRSACLLSAAELSCKPLSCGA